MKAVGYAYPWDFAGDPGAPARAAEVGVDVVALAAAYHTTRVPTPQHPTRRLMTTPQAACYLPVRPSAWKGSRLVPRFADWLDTPDPFGEAATAIREQGLGVYAWMVFTHTSVLGSANPNLLVRNAFGELYEYALCPSAEEVVGYCATLAGEIVETGEPDGVILEACGRLGIDHGGHHDKVDFAQWTAAQKRLLSLCFCAACQRLYTAAGIDADRMAELVRAAVGPEGDAPESVETALGEDLAEAVAAILADTAVTIRRRVVESARATRPDLPVTLHGATDRWATGAFTAIGGPLGSDVDSVVANCWAGGDTAVARLREMSAHVGDDIAVGGYFRPDTVRPPDGPALEDWANEFVAAGLRELHLYHLGLVPRPASAVLRALVAAAQLPAATSST
jgi:hypothetical protein